MKKQDVIKIEFQPNEAMLLWKMLQDILSQDAEGKKNGTGGLLYNQDVGFALSALTTLAEALDKHIKQNKVKTKLEIVK